MKFQLLARKVHYWLAIAVALPLAVIVATGLLLQLKKQLPWVQPPEQAGVADVPVLPMERILEIARGVPEAGVASWNDVRRLDVRPAKGMLKLWAKSDYEVQIDTRTGEVLQVAVRRSDLIESIHDGSWFSEGVKLGVFLPAGLALLVLWLSGMYLFWLPIALKARRRRTAADPEGA